jgi:hypothetical protein
VNYTVYFELGQVPMYVERYYRMLKYWCKILKTENIVLKTCYESMLESSHKKLNKKFNNFAMQIKQCFSTLIRQ